jgi:DNA end-binding protein Ku
VISRQQFVHGCQSIFSIDELYLANPYYIVPDGNAGTQAFAVIRDGIEKEGMVGIGRIVFTTREHTIALEARGKGILGVTLRYPYEVRDERKYFDDIPSERVTKDMLDLAAHIIKTKSGHFNPEKFEDHYERALKELLRKKDGGEKIEVAHDREPAKVINLMEALRRSAKGQHTPHSRRRRLAHHRTRKTRSPAPSKGWLKMPKATHQHRRQTKHNGRRRANQTGSAPR